MSFAGFRRVIDRAVEIVAGLLFVLMCLLVLAQIVARKLDDPLVWSEELARYIFIWVSFLGLAIAVRRNSHISIRLLVDALPPRLQALFGILIELSSIILALIFLRYGWELVLNNWDVSTVTLFFDFAVVYAIVPAAGFLMILTAAVNLLDHTRRLSAGAAS